MDEQELLIAPNPYLNRVAVKNPAEFFGRKREVAKIFSRIGASRPQSISIVGDRRIGKSSILNYVNNPEVRSRILDQTERYAFVFVDLQQKRRLTLTAFFRDFLTLLAKEVGNPALAGQPPGFDVIREILDGFRRDGRKLVVLFDEFEAITSNPAFDVEFFSFLRSIANNYDVSYITSSARDLQDLCRSQLIADSPFFNIFTNVYLRPFSRAEAMLLITEPSARANLPLEGYARRILEIAGQFPYFLQIAAAAYFDHLWENQGKLKREEVESTFFDEAKGQFRFMWDHLMDRDRKCIRDFAQNGRVDKEQEHIYKDLIRAGYIIEEEREPRMFSSLFATVISYPRVITTELKQTDRAAMALPEDRTLLLSPPLIEADGYIGRFNIKRLLGSGGMGEIFEAQDTELQRSVAIKVLAARYVEDESMKRRFLREARMASKLNHAGIATIYEIGEAAGNPFIVMEFVRGNTLAERLREGQLDLKSAVEIGRETADALAEAHDRGVVHRDIKPSNIMINERGRVKVLDFGLAKPFPLARPVPRNADHSSGGASAEPVTEPGILLGTVSYMSPEQASGAKDVSHLSDLFSLGVVLFESITGRLPFEGDNYFQTIEAIVNKASKPVRRFRRDTPPALVAVIEKLLRKKPEDRYQSASEVSADLSALDL